MVPRVLPQYGDGCHLFIQGHLLKLLFCKQHIILPVGKHIIYFLVNNQIVEWFELKGTLKIVLSTFLSYIQTFFNRPKPHPTQP